MQSATGMMRPTNISFPRAFWKLTTLPCVLLGSMLISHSGLTAQGGKATAKVDLMKAQNTLRSATAAVDVARAAIKVAEGDLKVAQGDISVAEAGVKQAEASLRQARLESREHRAEVRVAGIDEHVRRRHAEPLPDPFADPVDGALLTFNASDRTVVEEFARKDPYVTGGLVTAWKVREWTVVLGGGVTPPEL